MASIPLRFRRAPLTTQPIHLVFGEEGELPYHDPITLDGDGTLPELEGSGSMFIGLRLDGDGTLPELEVSGAMVYDSRTARPVARGFDAAFQQAHRLQVPLTAGFQQSRPLTAPKKIRWRDAVPLARPYVGRWQQSTPLPRHTTVRYQDARPLGGQGAVVRYQDALRTARPSVTSRYQDAVPLAGNGAFIRYQEALRHVRPIMDVRFQDATPFGIVVTAPFNNGRPLEVHTDSRYQDAIPPPPGIYIRPPEVPDPCYIPPAGDEVHLRFWRGWSNNTNLVFYCERHDDGPGPEPGDTIVIPVREVYVILNNASLRRVDGNIPLVTYGMDLSLNTDAWTWQFSASLPANQLANLEPGMDGDAVVVEALINGVPYQMVIESITRERNFTDRDIRIAGRGVNAVLDMPYAPIMTFGNADARTAAQLMDDVLMDNGVPLGWTVNFGLEDWAVPGGIWTFQGSHMGALNQIAQAAGGYIQPDRVDKNIIVLPRYPVAPWNWSSDVTPDYEVPDAFAFTDTVEWLDKAVYNRVFVSGTTGGVLRRVTRLGSDGGLVASTVVDSLVTDQIAGRQRGLSILADTGKQARVAISMPVPVETGLILPGKFVRYMEGATPRLGLVRGMNASVTLANGNALEITQTLNLETHLA